LMRHCKSMSRRDLSVRRDVAAVNEFRRQYVIGRRDIISRQSVAKFRRIIHQYYREHGRDFPWRHTTDPYRILVSEIMLQQTQTDRVVDKFEAFVRRFPTVLALAEASLRDVLLAWQGMGYNRRARHLHQIAQNVIAFHGGKVPARAEELARLPGIGEATACAICAFAFNQPTVFVETNIRTVFIHFFFRARRKVADREILVLAEAMLDRRDPRRWYSALMDYGAMLKKRHPNPSRKSAHHHTQAPFFGSRRQLRGLVLRTLLRQRGATTLKLISTTLDRSQDSIAPIIDELVKDRLVTRRGDLLTV
jgi:A/G-specific adenine glycosylase